MSRSMHEVLEDAMQLPAHERAELASCLIASLDDAADDPAEVEAAWDEEIGRRLADYDAGRTRGIPADVVFAEARQLIGRTNLTDEGREP